MTFEENKVFQEALENIGKAKEKVSDLVEKNHKNAMKLQKIGDLVLKYGIKLPKEFIKEFITIVKE